MVSETEKLRKQGLIRKAGTTAPAPPPPSKKIQPKKPKVEFASERAQAIVALTGAEEGQPVEIPESFREQPPTVQQFVDPETGQGVSIAPSLAREEGLVTKQEFETMQRQERQRLARERLRPIEPEPMRPAPVQEEVPRVERMPGAVIQPATPAERRGLRVARSREFVTNVLGGVGAGLFGEQRDVPPSPAAQRAFEATLIGSAVVPAGRAAKATGAAARVVRPVSRAARPVITRAKAAAQATQRTRAGRFLSDIGIGTGQSVAIVQTGKGISAATAPEEQKELRRRVDFGQIIGTAFEAEREALREQPFYKSLAFEISPYFSTEKGTFKASVRQQLQAQGFTEQEIRTGVAAAKRERRSITVSEAAANINIARFAEGAGRRRVTRVFERRAGEQIPKGRTFPTIFKRTFAPIAEAGAIEGVGAEVTQQLAREQDLNLANIGIMGGAGALTAGTLGGTIAGLRPTRPITSKAVEVGTFIVDPFEKPGDIAQDITQAATKRITGRAPRVPVITQPVDAATSLTIGVQGRRRPRVPAPRVPTPTPAETLETIIGTPDVTPTPEPTITPDPTVTPTLTPTKPITPTDIFNIQQPITTTTVTPISIQSAIPTRTPQPRIPPPLPLTFPAFGAGAGVARRTQARRINEIQASLNLISSLTGRGQPRMAQIIRRPQRPMPSKRKRKKKR